MTFKEGAPDRQAEAERIVTQYRGVVGKLESMFKSAMLRTTGDEWRIDGVGSCREIPNKYASEDGLRGPAKDAIIALRDVSNLGKSNQSQLTGCPFFRDNKGCILTDVNLKAPVCISYFENGAEWKRRFGINTRDLRENINSALNHVLTGYAFDHPDYVDGFLTTVETHTERINQEPVLYGGTIKDRARVVLQKIRQAPKRLRDHWEYTRG